MNKNHINISHILLCAVLAGSCLTACESQSRRTETVVISDTVAEVISEPEHTDDLSAPDTLFADGTRPSSWSSAGFTDPSAFKNFLSNWKVWVQAGMKDSIVAYTKFPLPAYKDKAGFLKAWPVIFSAEMKRKIAAQPLNEIFRNYQGAMIVNGAFWFSQFPEGYRLIAVNKP
ncbi:hypothetical protein [Sediminibacterium ginsengisoli]|uniref:Uncharacterized protein n=1 Tax=Sediminibacterium ginsengisoli TaxID=413434 RepID=A0A1T4L0J4_9BACT|nr:hypothetical protein [Sediminibacterium ginsengisoli]SJZ48163.1 hypothetical protein SAMN04488132_102230 [Sediminibacterium ginsengisoli]